MLTQLRASPNTVASYRDTFRLLLAFTQRRTGKTPSKLQLEDLDAVLIGAFLEHLEVERHNSVRTRNTRLAAVHSLFAYAALRHPEHAALIQRVLAIPAKRTDRQLVSFLTRDEVDALLAAPDRDTWVGRRDHALLLVAVQTGLRVSELTTLTCEDVELGTGAHLRCHGKGRKERITPLTIQACGVLRVWLAERRGEPSDPLFPSRRRGSLSRDAVALLVAKHARVAGQRCPSLGRCRRTSFVTRVPCLCSPSESTSPSSRSGSDTKASRPLRSTFTPTSPSKNGRSPAPRPPGPRRAAIAPSTRSSPSSKRCDYADLTSAKPLSHKAFRALLGIIRCSA
jgi:integrase/recombinase XerD